MTIQELREHPTPETAIDLFMVNISMIDYLVDKYNKKQKYTRSEKVNCYAYDEQTKKYISCINRNGDCFIDEYTSLQELQQDLY